MGETADEAAEKERTTFLKKIEKITLLFYIHF